MLRARISTWAAAWNKTRANGAGGSRFLGSAAAQPHEKDETQVTEVNEVDESGINRIVEALNGDAQVTNEVMQPWKGMIGVKTVTTVLERVNRGSTALGFFEWACGEELLERRNITEGYTLLLHKLATAGMGKEVRCLLKKMRETGYWIKKAVFAEIMTLLVRTGQAEEVLGVAQSMLENHWVSFQVEVVRVLYEEGKTDAGCSVLDSLASANVSNREALSQLATLIIGKNDVEGWKALEKVLKTESDYNLMLDHLCKELRVEQACNLLDRMVETGMTPGLASYSLLVDGFLKASMFSEAHAVLDVMVEQGCVPETMVYNQLLDGLCKNGKVKQAFKVFKSMVENGCSPNTCTYNTLINGLCMQGDITKARTVMERMISGGFVPNTVTYTSLITGYRKLGQVNAAIQVLDEMSSKGCVAEKTTYLGLVGALCKDKDVESVIKLIREHKNRFDLDAYTYGMVISTYGKFGKLDQAKELYQEMRARRLPPTLIVLNSLMFVLCQKRQVDEAMEMYRRMPKNMVPDLYTYTILIGGMCDAGRIDEACALKETMINNKCKPDKVTYGILVAGLFKAGKKTEAEELKKDMASAEIPAMLQQQQQQQSV